MSKNWFHSLKVNSINNNSCRTELTEQEEKIEIERSIDIVIVHDQDDKGSHLNEYTAVRSAKQSVHEGREA